MENILESIKLKFETKLPFSYVIETTPIDINNSDFTEKLCKSAYISYITGDKKLCNDILSKIINIPFDGNYNKWTWIEFSINLMMYIYLNENNILQYNKLKKLIYNQFEYPKTLESTRRIALKAFTRRILGQSLNNIREKVEIFRSQKDIGLEFGGLLSYYRNIIFIYTMNEGAVEETLKEELQIVEKRLKEIIYYYE